MTDQAPDTVKKRPWIKIILFASLAFNLLIMGLVVGTVMGGPRDRDKNPILRDLGFGPFVQALDRSEKRALTDAMKQQSGSFRENRAEIRKDFEGFLAALRAQPFDVEAARALVTRQRSRILERQAIGQGLLLDRIAAMDAETRKAYADRLDEMLRRGPRGRYK